MVMLKKCKKCRGDLYMESDRYGTYVSCIQCGAVVAETSGTVGDASQLAMHVDGQPITAQRTVREPSVRSKAS